METITMELLDAKIESMYIAMQSEGYTEEEIYIAIKPLIHKINALIENAIGK